MTEHTCEQQLMSPSLEWREDYSVAHPALDAEHREIMQGIRAVTDTLDNGGDSVRLRPLLCALKEKAAAHFAHEDTILREIAAFTSSAHRGHKFLAAMSHALIDEHLAGHAEAANVLDLMIRETLHHNTSSQALDQRLTHWFVDHAVKHDAHLKTLFQTIRSDCPELLARVA